MPKRNVVAADLGRACERAMQEERRAVARGDLLEAAYWAEVAETASAGAFHLSRQERSARCTATVIRAVSGAAA